jgi:hypothetical protein
MSIGSIISVVLMIAAVVGIVLSRRRIKKESPQKTGELYEQLRSIGLKVTKVTDDALMEESGEKSRRGRNAQEVLRIEGKKIDFVMLTGEAQQYGVTYYLDFLVKRNRIFSGQKVSNTVLKIRKGSSLNSEIDGFYWQGDPVLQQKLNDDYRLSDMLMQANRKYIKGGITIYPEPRKSYARIRVGHQLLEPEMIKVVDAIAGYIKKSY